MPPIADLRSLIHQLDTFCGAKYAEDDKYVITDMRETCAEAGVPELYSSFETALVSKCGRREVDPRVVHWRVSSFLAGYNQKANRYMADFGVALRALGASGTIIDSVRTAGVSTGARSVARHTGTLVDDARVGIAVFLTKRTHHVRICARFLL